MQDATHRGLRSLGPGEYAAWTAAADTADPDAIVASLIRRQQPAAPAAASDTDQDAAAVALAAVPDFTLDAADASSG